MTFIPASDVARDALEWGELGWIARPANVPESASMTAIEAILEPGQGHDFHKHPNQDEIIHVVSGTVEQWIGEECRTMTSGDSCFVPKNTVHASFVAVDGTPARLFVVLSPSHGEGGYEAVEVSTEAPWSTLRA